MFLSTILAANRLATYRKASALVAVQTTQLTTASKAMLRKSAITRCSGVGKFRGPKRARAEPVPGHVVIPVSAMQSRR